MHHLCDGVEKPVAYCTTAEAARLDRLQGLGEPREGVPKTSQKRAQFIALTVFDTSKAQDPLHSLPSKNHLADQQSIHLHRF